jgi:hypothetical protein
MNTVDDPTKYSYGMMTYGIVESLLTVLLMMLTVKEEFFGTTTRTTTCPFVARMNVMLVSVASVELS